ncbi:MAG: outer membrane protein [Candidatus Collierbacteria bacterium GW2011_GWA1_45_15]|nr:MAG: outer membrane protein [Candidatus Collierbacteria bacterium GW2011_GWA1_45_15]
MKDIARLAWVVFGVGFLLAVVYFFPWKDITWGRLMMSPERTVTVTGYAESKEKNQIANYSAGVNAVKDSKDEAVKEVNDKIKAITEAVKDFGVDPSDIQTQSMSVYQRQESYYDNGVQKSKPGQWDVNNTITVTLRNVNRASAMADLLTKSGATNVYGPNFQLDTSKKAEDSLMTEAIADAKIKAEAMAVASGTGLDKVISVSEGSAGGVSYPLYAMDGRGGGGGVAVEPGSTKISKTVTVVWSLK